MVADKGKNEFASMDDAVAYFEDIYKGLPPSIIQTAIEYCMKNPDKYPENYQDIDLKKVPKMKKEKEIVIEGAVEIYDSPDDPRVKVIKHRDGATLLSAEEALELQTKVNEALAHQEKDDEAKKKRDELDEKFRRAKERVSRKK